ncbi:MAG: hypothetical protein EA369_10265 [Bradymonadales bacterium]|nr:MAG: hypothetical protein EA369_10265 [Bradymonadales bacterium]
MPLNPPGHGVKDCLVREKELKAHLLFSLSNKQGFGDITEIGSWVSLLSVIPLTDRVSILTNERRQSLPRQKNSLKTRTLSSPALLVQRLLLLSRGKN